ncbi:hypothetical protein [Flavobacterium sp. J27]|uniref:NADase-type glycan-binding domain-containing protein n=1 Tax=Flavobacterium sp. J27 TaxID=2060419 RepID=UPI0013EEC9C1|nr:hypothetical protein [Flavobacterium sp. J27]
MRIAFLTLFFLYNSISFSQNIKEMKPKLGSLIEKSPAGELAFEKSIEDCNTLFEKINQKKKESFTPEEKKQYEDCLEDREGYWDVLGVGCSWYCGGGLDTISASSALKTNKEINYIPKNIHDLNYKTAWIEGVPGYGIGETITYHFPPENPRITEIIIVNGYVKSDKSWRENSRVKKLKMYLNDIPFALLHLEDSKNEQSFYFDPLGNSDRNDFNSLQKQPWWTITFEIVEVYKGEKYDDTAITEIYFDGIDVH